MKSSSSFQLQSPSPSTAINTPFMESLQITKQGFSEQRNSIMIRPEAFEGVAAVKSKHIFGLNRMFGAQLISTSIAKDMTENNFASSQVSSFKNKAIRKEKKLWRTMKVFNDQTGRQNQQMQCKVCNKKFNKLSNVKDHVRTHSDSRPYSCALCH